MTMRPSKFLTRHVLFPGSFLFASVSQAAVQTAPSAGLATVAQPFLRSIPTSVTARKSRKATCVPIRCRSISVRRRSWARITGCPGQPQPIATRDGRRQAVMIGARQFTSDALSLSQPTAALYG
jgi:hypothetical protein